MPEDQDVQALMAKIESLSAQLDRVQQQLAQIQQSVTTAAEESKERDKRLFGFLFMRRDISVLR